MTWQEYQHMSELIVLTMKDMVRETGVESVVQADLINRLIRRVMESGSADAGMSNSTTLALASEKVQKARKVIQQLISKENILIVTQDSKNKNERSVSLNINMGDDEMC